MAGQYPLGYDLFTYIFQYEFLVNKKLRFELLLDENIDIIQSYFEYFKVTDWWPYFIEFSDLKFNLETEKNNNALIKPYLELKKYTYEYRNPWSNNQN
jgi:hypothetical protein